MARPKLDLHKKVRDVLAHTEEPPAESSSPIKHLEQSTNAILNSLRYIDNHIEAESIYLAVLDRHLATVRRMALGALIQATERFIKELAVVCADKVAGLVNDDRFDEFTVKGASVALNFTTAGSVGKLLCESETWMNAEFINKSFRKFLKSSDEKIWGGYIFLGEDQNEDIDKGLDKQARQNARKAREQEDAERRAQSATMEILWQIRHTIAHNLGLLTRSDAKKLRVLMKGDVKWDRVLAPTDDDIRFVKEFLLRVARSINDRVGKRLAELLTEISVAAPAFVVPQELANEISRQFSMELTIGGFKGVL